MANKRSNTLVLTGSVGLGGNNARKDIKALQTCLNAIGDAFKLSPKLAVDGSLGRSPERSATVRAIRDFQRIIIGMTHPDGRIDKDGRSHRQLNACLQKRADDASARHDDHSLQTSPSPSTNAANNLSTAGIQLLQSIETLATAPYDDQTGAEISQWCSGATIGYGHLIARHEWNTYCHGMTEGVAEELFCRDLQPFVDAVTTNVVVPLAQHELDALVILAFNIGVSGFSSSSVVAMINNPQVDSVYDTLEHAWKAWNKSQGKIMQGLVKRRACEWNIYSQAIYEKW